MPTLLTVRSREKENLDNEIIDTDDLNKNLSELHSINNLLGGYHASRKGLAAIIKKQGRISTILDIGFGGGDSIKNLALFGIENKIKLFFYGVDLKEDCLNYAEKNLSEIQNKKLECLDYRDIEPKNLEKIDVIHCSLFLHHLEETEIIDFFKMARIHKCIVLINDLHRHWLAFHSIKILTSLFSKSWLIKSDAPLSVKRGFKKKELISLLQSSGFTDYTIRWSWAFRYIIIAYK